MYSEALGKILQAADPTNGICCEYVVVLSIDCYVLLVTHAPSTCIDEPVCECRSVEQIMCETAGNVWVTSGAGPTTMPTNVRKRVCKCPPAQPGRFSRSFADTLANIDFIPLGTCMKCDCAAQTATVAAAQADCDESGGKWTTLESTTTKPAGCACPGANSGSCVR